MTISKTLLKLALSTALSSLLCSVPIAFSQQRQEPRDDVLRVYTDLVQTDVMVFDKQGRFAKDLRKEDFELRIDGKPRPIEFFERITAGTANEETQLAAARGVGSSTNGAPVPLDRGRAVFFYIDDLHLDLAGTTLTRKMVSRYIDVEMAQNDQAAIASASGQLGFLQQLTDNKAVLRKALDQLQPRETNVRDVQRPPMSEYHAFLIDRYDRDVTDYFVEAQLKDTPGIPREVAEQMVRNRSQQLLMQSANITRATLAGLEGLIKSSSKLPGRKLVFFLSNGFFLDERNSDSLERLRRLTSVAARNGVVIYSMDARGLVASLTGASSDVPFDISGRLERANQGELTASQDALFALAADTGGRAVLNTNALDPGMKRALDETSTYYLLAWKPDPNEGGSNRFRKIDVKLAGKPDLKVRVRSGFYSNDLKAEDTKDATDKKPQKTPEANLAAVLTAPYPDQTLPVSVTLAHLNMPDKGDLLSVSLQVVAGALTFSPDADGKRKAVVQISGTIHNAKGQIGSRFGEGLSITAAPQGEVRDVGYTYPVFLKPGLYQARVGVVDMTSGKAGSAHAWIEIPDIAAKQLAMSSLLIGERKSGATVEASSAATDPTQQVNISVDHRLRQGSFLRFLVFVYNAGVATPNSKPDVAVQVQILRDSQPVITTALRKVDVEEVADLSRLPYAAEINLESLPVGRYLLIVTAVDRVSKRSVAQQTKFEIVR